MNKNSLILKLIMLLVFFTNLVAKQNEARLLRFPAIHGDKIVFTYAGDLYSVDSKGGVARKLTNDIGYEMFARFSPDGKHIAFTAQYDGNTEVYLMPSEGGIPKRLTVTATLNRDDVSDRMGPNNIVMCWKDNETIIYRSRWREFNDFKGQLYEVSINGGLSKQLPLPRGGFCSFSPDKSELAYNRVFREFRTWKRYRGGQADDIWIYNFKTKKTINITNNPAQDIIPMWKDNFIYFISDRDGRFNLYSYNINTKETKKLTDFTDYDIKFPSLGDNAIVFENGGYIYKFDFKTQKAEKVTIYLNEDFDIGRGGLIDVSKNVTNYEISPDGKRALFGTRGEIFTVPAKNGSTRNLTNTSGIHERNSKWSPDGKWIAFISDKTGEDEIYIIPQDGKGEPVQLTFNSNNYKYEVKWSPDSKKILWNDRLQRLFYVDIETKKVTLVDKSDAWEITSFAWSPDSRWIAYAKPEDRSFTKIYIYSLDENKSYEITDSWYDSYGPEFSDDGKYLYFISERTFNPRYGQTEFNHIYTDMAKIYFVTLAKDTKSPFEPKSDEVTIKDNDKSTNDVDKNKEKKESKTTFIKIDFDNIKNRIAEVTPEGSTYWGITSAGEKIYYMKRSSTDKKSKLALYDLEKKSEIELGEADGFEISMDKKKMIVGNQNSYYIIDLPNTKLELKEKLSLEDLKINLDRYAEWHQIFNECWRQMRDFFFDPNMHGVDWEKVKKNYEPLVDYVNHRADLTYIIGEMIGELNIGHTYVGGGDYPKPDKIKLGLLGAELERDNATKFYKIKKILKGQNWDKNLRSPLTEIGVNVKEGEYIIAVNGKLTNQMNDIYESLINTANKQVTLTINSLPKIEGSRETTVVPIDNEQPLYYLNWVENNIEKVNKATNGRVGYIHIPDMGINGLNQFAKLYYPQLKKEALIIDDRGNGGGNVSPMILERLNRKLQMITIARNTKPNVDPSGTHYGPKVLLLDEYSASDGDIFPYRFRQAKLGKLIGKRSWGGVVGIRGTLPLLDGGFLNKPEFSRYDIEGKEWIMEGYGVEPDIIVDNDPAMEFEGIDEQLNKAIEVIMEELKNNPPKIAPPPPYPDKSK
ncbi:S41 family peptidase [Rosettibacter firmus]|uniref:S41 family peptidase n=1 Tax=Rosettibacter firmus TaxID=3111522 RepID=UPI00336C2D25